jgi:hypothetical protein
MRAIRIARSHHVLTPPARQMATGACRARPGHDKPRLSPVGTTSRPGLQVAELQQSLTGMETLLGIGDSVTVNVAVTVAVAVLAHTKGLDCS